MKGQIGKRSEGTKAISANDLHRRWNGNRQQLTAIRKSPGLKLPRFESHSNVTIRSLPQELKEAFPITSTDEGMQM
jgi:hypothetical protein